MGGEGERRGLSPPWMAAAAFALVSAVALLLVALVRPDAREFIESRMAGVRSMLRSSSPPSAKTVSLSVLSFNVWGTPESFGSQFKEERIEALASVISKGEYDVYLLQVCIRLFISSVSPLLILSFTF